MSENGAFLSRHGCNELIGVHDVRAEGSCPRFVSRACSSYSKKKSDSVSESFEACVSRFFPSLKKKKRTVDAFTKITRRHVVKKHTDLVGQKTASKNRPTPLPRRGDGKKLRLLRNFQKSSTRLPN